MGNSSSVIPTSPSRTPCSSSSRDKKSKRYRGSAAQQAAESATERARKLIGEAQESFKSGVKKLEEQDHPAAQLIDSVCGPYLDGHGKMRDARSASSFYSEDIDSDLEEDDSRTISDDEQTLDTDVHPDKSTIASSSIGGGPVTKPHNKKDNHSSMDSSYMSQSDYDESEAGGGRHHGSRRKKKGGRSSLDSDTEDDSTYPKAGSGSTGPGQAQMQLLSKPLASSFAKRCYFTKAGIGKTTQHYEGLTLTGNVVLMLASAMKLKGCPTICDEDLRRVEQTYPNQFSRLPDELLLSSGWRRISKYCHFSNKPIPDGIPFFHSRQRLHPQGGYFFLLAAAVGMVRPIDVEPLTRDTLVLLETDYPSQCDAAPDILIQDPTEWTLVDKFCFFSGGPINTEEDVYYQADFDGNPIYMLAFLSPSLTPEELYKLEGNAEDENGIPMPGLTSVAAVEEVESVYDLTDRDFHDLKLYHLGPCRALPQYILQPQAWAKVLPPHFLEARHQAILRAQDYEMRNGGPPTPMPRDPMAERAQQLSVGAAPADGRYDVYDHGQHQHQFQHQHGTMGPGGTHIPGTSPGEYVAGGVQDGSYYMQQQAAMMGDREYSTDYGASFGPQPGSPMYQEQRQHEQFQHYEQHPDDKYNPNHQFHRHPDSPYSPQRGAVHEEYNYQEDDRSSGSQREDEEAAFADENVAPEDEAWQHHHQRMDPPEEGPMSPTEVDDSMAASETMSANPNNISNSSGNYYDHDETHSRHSNDNHGIDGPYGDDAVDDYVYSHSREDEYYDSPEGLEKQPVSHDHEFFNAPSGGGDEDDEMGFDPDTVVSSFDPKSHIGDQHPDDQLSDGGEYYDDEASVEYRNQPQSPPAINVDHLRNLGRKQPPKSPYAMSSPMSAASSQNSTSEYSHSSAMRGAQELLKRNRLRRQQQARQRQNVRGGAPLDPEEEKKYVDAEEDFAVPTSPNKIQLDYNMSHSADESEHNSEAVTSVVSGSSVWTDSSSNPNDRSSRRALILQMAKARMKSNKDRDPSEGTIKEEKSGMGDSYDGSGIHYSLDDDDVRHQGSASFPANELDLTADLD